MSVDVSNPMATVKAGLTADLAANAEAINAIAKAHADSQKSDNSTFALRDTTPLDEIDEEIRPKVAGYRDNVAKLEKAIKDEKAAIASVLGISDKVEFDKVAAKAEYLSLKAHRANTIKFVLSTNLFTEDEIKALDSVMSWGGGTVSDAAAAAMRPRFSEMTFTNGDDTVTVDPATSGELAKRLNKLHKGEKDWDNVDSSALTGLFVNAAGGDLKKADSVEITVGDHKVTATPKRDA